MLYILTNKCILTQKVTFCLIQLKSIWSVEGRKIRGWMLQSCIGGGRTRQLWRNGRRVGQGSEKGWGGNKGDSIKIWKRHERCTCRVQILNTASMLWINHISVPNHTLFQVIEETKISIWLMGNKQDKKVLLINDIKHLI